jgi:hypothetical protein
VVLPNLKPIYDNDKFLSREEMTYFSLRHFFEADREEVNK